MLRRASAEILTLWKMVRPHRHPPNPLKASIMVHHAESFEHFLLGCIISIGILYIVMIAVTFAVILFFGALFPWVLIPFFKEEINGTSAELQTKELRELIVDSSPGMILIWPPFYAILGFHFIKYSLLAILGGIFRLIATGIRSISDYVINRG